MTWIDAEKVENNQDIEVGWAIKATAHAETYMKLLVALKDPHELKLTPKDDDIYESFRQEFPDFRVDVMNIEELKSGPAKEKWRPWCMQFEKSVEDFNFATLVRIDASKDYTEENTILVTRVQFLAIEIARNREGMNKNLARSS